MDKIREFPQVDISDIIEASQVTTVLDRARDEFFKALIATVIFAVFYPLAIYFFGKIPETGFTVQYLWTIVACGAGFQVVTLFWFLVAKFRWGFFLKRAAVDADWVRQQANERVRTVRNKLLDLIDDGKLEVDPTYTETLPYDNGLPTGDNWVSWDKTLEQEGMDRKSLSREALILMYFHERDRLSTIVGTYRSV